MRGTPGNSPYSTRSEREREKKADALQARSVGAIGNTPTYAPPRGTGGGRTPQDDATNLLRFLRGLKPDDAELSPEDQAFRERIERTARSRNR